jgi:hypothetical protein
MQANTILFINFLKTIKKFSYTIIIIVLIVFNVLTLASAAIYSTAYGLISSLPMVSELFTDSMQIKNNKLQKINKKYKQKIKKISKIVKNQRKLLLKKSVTQTTKKASSALIPFAGSLIVVGIGIQEYCNNLKDNVDLYNSLNDTAEKFDYDKCYGEAEKDTESTWKYFKDLF